MVDDVTKAVSPRKGRLRMAEPAARGRRGLTVRMRDHLRDQLETAAVSNGRSLSEEIEIRMEIQFALDRHVRSGLGETACSFAEASASSLKRIEKWTGTTFATDARTRKLLELTALRIIHLQIGGGKDDVPSGEMSAMSDDDLAKVFASGAV